MSFDPFLGYGGFGYDTSHVPPDESHSPLYHAAKEGDLERVKAIILSSTKTDKQKQKMINHARRWTEVDYKMSGFTKEWEWFDMTPLHVAARAGHGDVVQYLLEQCADPTLQACPSDNRYTNALQEGKDGLKRFTDLVNKIKQFQGLDLAERDYCHRLWGSNFIGLEIANESAKQVAARIFQRISSYKRCIAMLETVKPYWKEASYAGAGYVPAKRSRFSNAPRDKNEMIAALTALVGADDDPEATPSQEEVNALVSDIEVVQEHSKEQKRQEEERKAERKRREEEVERERKRKKRERKARYCGNKKQKGKDTSVQQPCRHFLKGTCRYGENCRFKHESGIR